VLNASVSLELEGKYTVEPATDMPLEKRQAAVYYIDDVQAVLENQN